MNDIDIQNKLLDELMEYAERGMAGDLKAKYAPKPAPAAEPKKEDEPEFDVDQLGGLFDSLMQK